MGLSVPVLVAARRSRNVYTAGLPAYDFADTAGAESDNNIPMSRGADDFTLIFHVQVMAANGVLHSLNFSDIKVELNASREVTVNQDSFFETGIILTLGVNYRITVTGDGGVSAPDPTGLTVEVWNLDTDLEHADSPAATTRPTEGTVSRKVSIGSFGGNSFDGLMWDVRSTSVEAGYDHRWLFDEGSDLILADSIQGGGADGVLTITPGAGSGWVSRPTY